MSLFINDWYACFIQITTIWYIMTFISNPRILTSRSWLTYINVWEKFGSFSLLCDWRDGTIYSYRYKNKDFTNWLKEGGQCSMVGMSHSLERRIWNGDSLIDLGKGDVYNWNITPDLPRFRMWGNITVWCIIYFWWRDETMETNVLGKEWVRLLQTVRVWMCTWLSQPNERKRREKRAVQGGDRLS